MERCDINKIACSHNDEVDASTSGHPHLPRQFYSIFFLLTGSQEKYEKMSPQARLPLRLRHLIITAHPPPHN